MSTELMNSSNMTIIHCIWAGGIAGREEIKSSKRPGWRGHLLPEPAEGRWVGGWVGGRRAAPGSHHPTPVLPQAPSPALRWHELASPVGGWGCQARGLLMVAGNCRLLRGALPL